MDGAEPVMTDEEYEDYLFEKYVDLLEATTQIDIQPFFPNDWQSLPDKSLSKECMHLLKKITSNYRNLRHSAALLNTQLAILSKLVMDQVNILI